ncbi:glycoside hydrolase family 3 C-terminal domain-containing protein [Bacteroides sp. 224]|uniref:glycoside hydrolase family 3 C-terminal domain-containing protein n=1 Tax=Bacteroides sp. 224 TaxID=2302936 RepID=UPI0013D1FD50|nr:glycoside hydrolase family 3 C-terminal domain-containing protein [Bacteroides sp. 224]NDV63706.1 glycoside hydrolase family 3 protein [Bacteroides sp. 224]
MKTKRLIGWVLCFYALSGIAQEAYKNPNLTPDERARDLLNRLTLEEKVGQMSNNTSGVKRLDIRPYDWWNEALHGVARAGKATVFPQAIGLAATFDEEAVHETFDMVSDEARAKYHDFQRKGMYNGYKGLTFWTPNVNIFRDPRWGRGMETYGEDPYLTTRMGLAVVKGLQGDGTQKYDKTHACAKHYAVHSGPEWNRHSFDAKNISERDLWETYLPAFKALVQEGKVKEVMCAYNRFEGEPCCSSKELLISILREEWGFDDIVVSDCGAIGDFYGKDKHETHISAASASADAVISSTDLECGGSYRSLLNAVKLGMISEEQINKSVFRLLRARFQLGMFDEDNLVSWASIPYSVVESQKHKDKALEMARKSMVLLSNKQHTLPLTKSIRKVAVMGPNANDSVMLWANYNGTPTKSVTILEGIRNKLPKGSVIYEKGCDFIDTQVDYKSIAEKVKDADAIIFVGGINATLEGEEMGVNYPGFRNGDRTDIELPQVQKNMLKALHETGKPVIFVLCSGSSMALTQENEYADAILAAWYPGQEGGTAVADVLWGDYNPAGRLPITFYASSSDLPDFEDYNMQEGRTYRYFKGKPLYPFGHGLSYTNFVYSNAKLSQKKIKAHDSVSLHFDIKNAGKMEGDEVVQVYIKNLQNPEGPVKSLRQFKRIHAKAGEKIPVTIELPASAFEFFNPEMQQMNICPGKYEILYGGTSEDSKLKSVTLIIQTN